MLVLLLNRLQYRTKLSQYTAQDAVIPDSPIVDSNLSIREFVNNYVIGKERWKKFLVVDENKQLVGSISTEESQTDSDF